MARKAPGSNSSDGLMESGFNPEVELLFHEIRKEYAKNKIIQREAKAEKKRRVLIFSACIFFTCTGLTLILYLTGLLRF